MRAGRRWLDRGLGSRVHADLSADGAQVVASLSGVGRRRSRGPLEPAPALPHQDPGQGRATGRGAASSPPGQCRPPLRAGRHPGLHPAPDLGQKRRLEAVRSRTPQRASGAPDRDKSTRRTRPRGREEAGQDPQRWGLAGQRRPSQEPEERLCRPTSARVCLRAFGRRRLLPAGLLRDPRQRDRRHRHRLLASSSGLLRRLWHHRRAGHDRQRLVLPLPGLHRRADGSGDRPYPHEALFAPDQRQGRALQPDPAQRMGLCPALPFRGSQDQGACRLAPPLQPSSTPHCCRWPTGQRASTT